VVGEQVPTLAPKREPVSSEPIGDPPPAEAASVLRSDADPPRETQPVSNAHDVGSSLSDQDAAERTTSPPSTSPGATAPARSAESPGNDGLLFTRQSPVLGVATLGPRRITVGKESAYEVAIRNSGQVAADQVVVSIDLPEWAEVLGAEVSKGATSSANPGGFRWEVGRVEAASEEKLTLRIVPRQSRPFDLAVQWDYTPAVSQAVIEVQEPKLDMRLEGPREVLYGESRVYRLELVNSGTGDAENVEISLVPIGTGENLPATHKIGTIEAGGQKVIEVELTARQAGTLTIKVDARGDGDVEAHLAQQIAVYRPALETVVQAPPIQYVGTEATYQIRVSNPGTAPAKDIAVTATIPPGAQYVSSAEGGQVATDQSTVTWTLDSLDVGAEATFDLTCNLARAGLSRLEVVSTASGGLTASGDVTIKVEAIADLELDVTDPAGPVPVGSDATYQVRVRNRGTRSAENVEVVAYFSRGVEPISVEGGRHRTAPGQVLFDPIPSLAAGQEVTLQIKAKAGTAGNHICRVELYCKPLETRLVSEETTHFYGGTQLSERKPISRSANVKSATQDKAIRTADQRPTPAPAKNN